MGRENLVDDSKKLQTPPPYVQAKNIHPLKKAHKNPTHRAHIIYNQTQLSFSMKTAFSVTFIKNVCQ